MKFLIYFFISLMSFSALPPGGGVDTKGFGSIAKTAGLFPPACGCTSCNVSSRFGRRTDPVFGGHAHHAGCDLTAPQGTELTAPCEGTISKAERDSGYGESVEIKCLVENQELIMKFAHMSKLDVREGDRISRGAKIGLSGSTGKSTGPHLHFEVRLNGVAIDSAPYFEPSETKQSCEALRQQTPIQNNGSPTSV